MKAIKKTGLWKVTSREFDYIFSKRRILVILCLIPILFTLLFGSIYSEKTIKNLKLGVINYSDSQVSRSLINSLGKSEHFLIKDSLKSEAQIEEQILRGQIDGVVIIPEDFTEKIKKGQETAVMVGANGSNMSVSSTILTKAAEVIGSFSTGVSIKRYESQGFSEGQAFGKALPVNFSIRNWYNPGVNYSDFLLPGYVAAILQQVLMYFAAISITEERKNSTINDLAEMKVSGTRVILGKMIPYILLGLTSWVISLIIMFTVFETPMRGSWLTMLVLSTVFLTFISSLALFISMLARRSLDATQYAMVIALPSFLLSGYTWPLGAMTGLFKAIAHVFPITYFVVNVRNIILMGTGLQQMLPHILLMLGLSLVFIFLSKKRWDLEFCG